MGFGSISAAKLLIVLFIILVVFGSKKLKTIGEDLGSALHQFRKGFKEGSTNHNPSREE